MKIVVTDPGQYQCLSADEPEPGLCYFLDDATEGTGAQNRAFHALCHEYFRSGLWSYPGSGYRPGLTFAEFRDTIKRDLGAGFESFVYGDIVEGRAVVRKAKAFEEIPEHIRHDPRARELILGKLRSWADYTKKQRRDTLDKLIAEMLQLGVNSKKFSEIMEGLGQ